MTTRKAVLFIALMLASLATFAGTACDTARQNVREFESLDNGTAQMRQFIDNQRRQADLICATDEAHDTLSGRSKRSSGSSDASECDRALAKWPDSRIDREMPEDSNVCDTDPASAQCCARRRSSLEFDKDMEACSEGMMALDAKTTAIVKSRHEKLASDYNQYCTGRSAASTSHSAAPSRRHDEASSTSNSAPGHSSTNSGSAPVQFAVSCLETYDFKLNGGKMDPYGTGRYWTKNTCAYAIRAFVCVQQKESQKDKWLCNEDRLSPGESVMHGLGFAEVTDKHLHTQYNACREDRPSGYMSPCGDEINERMNKLKLEHY